MCGAPWCFGGLDSLYWALCWCCWGHLLPEPEFGLACSSSPHWPPGWQVVYTSKHACKHCSCTAVCIVSLDELGTFFLPDNNSFVHVNIEEMWASAAIGFPVCFGVFVSQFVSSMMIGRHVHLLPALILRQFHTGAWKWGQSNQFKVREEHINKNGMKTYLGRGSGGTHQKRGCW